MTRKHTTTPVATPEWALERYYWAVFHPQQKLTSGTDELFSKAITALDKWNGRKVTLRDLSDSLVDRWKQSPIVIGRRTHKGTDRLSDSTVESYLSCITAVWQDAANMGAARPIGHEKPSPEWTLRAYFHLAYLLFRPIRHGYQYDRNIRKLGQYVGRAVLLSELCDELVSGWVLAMERDGMKPSTIKSNRMNVLCIWRHAARKKVIPGPDEVRLVRLPRHVPRCWTLDQFRKILRACDDLPGYLASGIPERLYFRALFFVAYETGLRKGDLLRLSLEDISDDGTIGMLQGKTLEGHVTSVSPETLQLLREISDRLGRDRHAYWQTPLHWPYVSTSQKSLYKCIEYIRIAAGVEGKGALQQIRRTGATYCEMTLPGSAPRYLGHKSTDLAYRFYVDRRKLGPAPRPPALTLQAEGGGE